jgi:hypothetical protein
MLSVPMSGFSTTQRVEQIANIVPWFDAGFVDGVPVLRHVLDHCIPGDEDVFDTYFEALLIGMPILFPNASANRPENQQRCTLAARGKSLFPGVAHGRSHWQSV